jgi:hypothetical protein
MELSHLLSEMVLSSAGFFTFYVCLRKLNTLDGILWGTFILAVSIAAVFAALRFAGFSGMIPFNIFFKQIASSVGVISLVMGAYSLVFNQQFSKKVVYSVLFIGFILMFVFIVFNLGQGFNVIPVIGIPIVFFLSIWAFIKGRLRIGLILLLATMFSVFANFIDLLQLPFNQVDTYCILLAAALICFGLAGKNREKIHEI